MKLTINSTDLRNKVNEANKVIPQRSPITILYNFLIDAKDGLMRITASDTENTLTLETGADVMEEGNVCVDAKFLSTLVRSLPEGPVSMSTKGASLTIKTATGKYHTPILDASNYPSPDNVVFTSSATLTDGSLSHGLSAVSFAVGNDDFHPQFMGVCIDCSDAGMRFYATDTRKLAKCHINASAPAFRIVLPYKAVHLLESICTPNVLVRISDKCAEFAGVGFVLRCQLISAKYPDVERIIPGGHTTRVVVNKMGLVSSIKRASLCSALGYKTVRLSFDPDNLAISARDLDTGRESQEEMSCTTEGAPITIGFSADIISSVLLALSGEDVQIDMTDPGRPAVLRSANDANGEQTLVAMPMSIKD